MYQMDFVSVERFLCLHGCKSQLFYYYYVLKVLGCKVSLYNFSN